MRAAWALLVVLSLTSPALAQLESNSITVNNKAPAASAGTPSFSVTNPCVGPGLGGGLQLQFFGVAIARQEYDQFCRLMELGERTAAKEYLCMTDHTAREALLRAGSPCLADLPPRVSLLSSKPAWCDRVHGRTNQTEASWTYIKTQCGAG